MRQVLAGSQCIFVFFFVLRPTLLAMDQVPKDNNYYAAGKRPGSCKLDMRLPVCGQEALGTLTMLF